VLRVMIASPSDVKKERDEIESEIFKWNTMYAENLNVVLLPSRWESDVTPTYHGDDPQEVINEQIVNKSDIVIGVFWTKLGNPTKNNSSGTLEELESFINKGKEVMLYFVDRNIPLDSDLEELKRVNDYKKQYSTKGVYNNYSREKIIEHLYRKVISISPQPISNVGNDDLEVGKLITSGKLVSIDILLLRYILDTGNRSLGVRWMEKETLPLIKQWEKKNDLLNELSQNYLSAVINLADRGLLKEEEYTGEGNVRLYKMNTYTFDQLQGITEEAIDYIDGTVKSFVFELPF